MRLRQAVFVANELEPFVSRLREGLGLGEPYEDQSVGVFGLRNTVMSIGEGFVEVVAPVREDTPAGRHLGRRGEGGYMLILQVEDLDSCRARARDAGIRAVWEADHPDIRATHLHPSDIGGTILSLDQPEPPESWRWAGPEWTGRAGTGPPGRILGATIEVADPERTAERWAHLLGMPAGRLLRLDDGGEIRFEQGDRGFSELRLQAPGAGQEVQELGTGRLIVNG